MKLVRVSNGHYETADGRWAVCRGTAGWYVATIRIRGERPIERGATRSTKREAVSRLAELKMSDMTST